MTGTWWWWWWWWCEELTSYAQSLFTFKILFITPVLHSVAMFLTVHYKQYFIENLVCKLINCWRTKCTTPNSSGLSVIAIQSKTQENFRTAATLLYRMPSTVNTSLTKFYTFLNIYYHTSLRYPKANSHIVAFAWEFRVFHDFYWLEEVIKSWLLSALRLWKFHIKVSEISSKVSKVAEWWSSREPRGRRRYKSDSLWAGRSECSNPSGRRDFLSSIPALRFIQSLLQWEPWLSHGSAAAVVWRLTTQSVLVPRLRVGTLLWLRSTL
jgi:hypothetical protein